MCRRAFTMIEVMAVVVLMALLAGAAAWSVAEDARDGSERDAVGRLIHADYTARLAARQMGEPCVLRFDLDEQRVQRFVGSDDRMQRSHSVRLAPPHRIVRLWLADPSASRNVHTGAVDIQYSSAGSSASYALCLTDGKTEQWLIVSGLTGQVTQTDDSQEVDNLFSMLTTGRADAR